MTLLFSPASLRGIELPNRIVVSPMCQYTAENGSANDWHLMHLGQLSMGAGGLLFTEATHVSPEGRITPGCLGLWSDENEQALDRVLSFCRRYGVAKLGIQLAHAGRKASTRRPLDGGAPLPPEEGAWTTVAPSALPFGDGWHVPKAADEADLEKIRGDFVAAARRAARLGIDVAELHMAHGYLMHEFLSPISNRRGDAYGGSLENRMRLPLEIFELVREVWPADRPLGVRVSASDWVDGGWSVEETVAFARELRERGCDFMDVSSGGNDPRQKIELKPGYQVEFARRVRSEAGLPVMAVGLITEARQAEAILAEECADFVALARGVMDDPRWAWHAARELGAETEYPAQYIRAHPKHWPGAGRR
ncbi:NADH:flavin oxidoreductase/NADH oxidase [Geminicoccaceae bacterium 1502E]|nr:NADH:flavin oxidoreductase/NADH oxidase [Geminicoccaceae bacterium 1502E]